MHTNALDSTIDQAQTLLQKGDYEKALEIAKQLLIHHPNEIQFLNFTGVCAASLKNIQEARFYWYQALSKKGNLAETYFNLGLSYAQEQEEQQAEYYYKQAITYNPDYALAYLNLGALFFKQQQLSNAVEYYEHALRSNPDCSEAYSNLGNVYLCLKKWELAQCMYQKALHYQPNDAQLYAHIAYSFAQRKIYPDAFFYYQQAIQRNPHSADFFSNLGTLLTDMKHYGEAERILLHALELNSELSQIYSNLGNVLMHQLREQEAETCYKKALQLEPISASTWCNLGALWASQCNVIKAEEAFRHALTLNPDHELSKLNLGYLLLSQGQWQEGWHYHESRYVPDSADGETIFPTLPFPKWTGESLIGSSLLIWLEQGYGDCIQFCRYALLLQKEGAIRITIACKPELSALLKTLSSSISIWEISEDIPPHDYWTFLLSIPYFRNTTLNTIPYTQAYLKADSKRIHYWSAYLKNSSAFRIGLVWKGNRYHSNDQHRSLPHFSMLAAWWSVPGLSFISLQKGQGEEEMLSESEEETLVQPILHLGSLIQNFADTAAIIAQLDLIICVDTAVAHLAGALGKPCWILLPAYKTDWRWLNDRNDSPWYPHTRLFRQKTRQHWSDVIDEVHQALINLKF